MFGFPTEQHVKEVCRPGSGEETCRYLTAGAAGWECVKGTSIGRQLEERGDSLNARGDNCPGIVVQLCDGRFVGKRVHHRETMPTFEVDGVGRELRISNGILELSADWDDGSKTIPSIALGYLEVSERGESVIVNTTFMGGNTWTFDP